MSEDEFYRNCSEFEEDRRGFDDSYSYSSGWCGNYSRNYHWNEEDQDFFRKTQKMNRRALHYVLKIGNLKKNLEFFRDFLKMKVLRHEVFDKGCEASCNGPYDGKWSKTMIGYGSEDDHFVLELTYNYSIGSYKFGNDLQYIKIKLDEDTFKEINSSSSTFNSPDGYKFFIEKGHQNDVAEVCLASSNLVRSTKYWKDLLGMKKLDDLTEDTISLNYSDDQAKLVLKKLKEPIKHESAFGRIAFSCPSAQLMPLQEDVEEEKEKVLVPYVSLDTPGKATVEVVILADPDGHEICFVGDEGFRKLSRVDPKANDLIEKSIEEDKSDEWFNKKDRKKQEA